MSPLHAAMSEEELGLLNELFSAEVGMTFCAAKREILESRLRPRLVALRLRSFRDYYLYLLHANGSGETERRELARIITNNETYFFRESYQFEALFEEALDGIKDTSCRSGTLRMLCAGCSSGEEAYTLSIYARENAFRAFGWNFEIEGFDISDVRIRTACEGAYGASSLRSVTPEQVQRYFHPADSEYRLKPLYRTGVRFRLGNLLDAASYGLPSMTDVIFCRNVLIYFSEGALLRAVENFAQALRPGGLLFLGHSESIIGLSPQFEPERLGNTIVYRRV